MGHSFRGCPLIRDETADEWGTGSQGSTTIERYGDGCSVAREDQSGAALGRAAGGWVSCAGDGVPDAAAARCGDGVGARGGGDVDPAYVERRARADGREEYGLEDGRIGARDYPEDGRCRHPYREAAAGAGWARRGIRERG